MTRPTPNTPSGESAPGGRTLADIDAAIEASLDAARARQAAASPGARSRMPCETDWATSEELSRLHALQLERAAHPDGTAAAARARVAAKRARRRAAARSANERRARDVLGRDDHPGVVPVALLLDAAEKRGERRAEQKQRNRDAAIYPHDTEDQ